MCVNYLLASFYVVISHGVKSVKLCQFTTADQAVFYALVETVPQLSC